MPLERRLRADLDDWRERLQRGDVEVCVAPTEVLFRPTAGMMFHHNPEIFLQLGGRTEFAFPTGRLTLRAGEACVMPTGVPHGEVARDGAAPFRTLVLVYARTSMACIYARVGERRTPVVAELGTYRPIEREQVEGLVQACQAFAAQAGRRREAGLVLGALLGVTALALDHPLKRRAHADWSPLVLRCHDLLWQRFASPHCNVAQLARELGCTPNYLSAKYHREAGATLTRHLNERRLEHARHLLRTTSRSVREIAYASGYEHPSYFIARYRQRYGRTPGADRRALRGSPETGGAPSR